MQQIKILMEMACQMAGNYCTGDGLEQLSQALTIGQWIPMTLMMPIGMQMVMALSNLCEYQWSLIKQSGLVGDLLESHLETEQAVALWAEPDPNNKDSDGILCRMDGKLGGACTWDVSKVGINPLNGSDLFENPDGDGYDINHNGVIEDNEAFVNWLEYNIRDKLFSGNMSLEGEMIPEGFSTDLFRNISDNGAPEGLFSDGTLTGDPTSADSDSDGMPDGWEIWYARWNIFDGEWTLNPL